VSRSVQAQLVAYHLRTAGCVAHAGLYAHTPPTTTLPMPARLHTAASRCHARVQRTAPAGTPSPPSAGSPSTRASTAVARCTNAHCAPLPLRRWTTLPSALAASRRRAHARFPSRVPVHGISPLHCPYAAIPPPLPALLRYAGVYTCSRAVPLHIALPLDTRIVPYAVAARRAARYAAARACCRAFPCVGRSYAHAHYYTPLRTPATPYHATSPVCPGSQHRCVTCVTTCRAPRGGYLTRR